MGFAGYAFSIVGAYLGGHLVYNERIGVNHAAEELPEKFVPLMKESELAEGEMVKAEAEGVPVLVVRRGDRISIGTVLGLSGNTGNSTAPHLHFEVRRNNATVDPMTLIQQPRQ